MLPGLLYTGESVRRNNPAERAPEDAFPGSEEPVHGADDRAVFRFAKTAVRPVDRRRMDSDQHLVVLGKGGGNLLVLENLRGSVSRVYNCLHKDLG
jgi:hypothetical protein